MSSCCRIHHTISFTLLVAAVLRSQELSDVIGHKLRRRVLPAS